MKQIAIAALAAGAAVALFSIIGFSAVTGRRRIFMNFFSVLLLCLSIFEFAFAILSSIRYSKVGFDDASNSLIFLGGRLHKCCLG